MTGSPLPYIPDTRGGIDRFVSVEVPKHPRLAGLVTLVGIAGAILVHRFGPRHAVTTTLVPGQPPTTSHELVGLASTAYIAFIAVGVLGGVGLVLWVNWRTTRLPPNTRTQRITALKSALEEAMLTIEGIRTEVEEGDALLQRLTDQASRQTQLVNLQQAQVEAVADALGSELRRANRRSLPTTLAINCFFAVAGAVVGRVLHWP